MHLEPSQCQVLMVHMQSHLVEQCATEHPDVLGEAARALCELAGTLDMPVTFGSIPDEGRGSALVEPLRRYATSENLFERQSASVLHMPALAERLRRQERGTVLLGGFAAEVVVLHSALDALEAGYRVVVVVDAVGGQSERTEKAALDEIARAGGVLLPAVSVLSLLAPYFDSSPGSTALSLIKDVGSARARTASGPSGLSGTGG